MKKILLPFLLLIANYAASAQCTPGLIPGPGNAYIIPDAVTNFVHGCQGNPYEQILYIKAAKDTTISIGIGTVTADIDSFVVDANIVGLPNYLTVESIPALLPAAGPGSPKSNYARLVIKGDSLACIRISGTVPIGASVGTTNLTVNMLVYTSNIHSADALVDAYIPVMYPGRKTDTNAVITGYEFVVDPIPCWAVGVNDLTKYDFEIINAIPNPTSGNTRVAFISNTGDNYNYKLVNHTGQVIMEKTMKADMGINYINVDANNLSAGHYMFSLSNDKNVQSQKIQVNR